MPSADNNLYVARQERDRTGLVGRYVDHIDIDRKLGVDVLVTDRIQEPAQGAKTEGGHPQRGRGRADRGRRCESGEQHPASRQDRPTSDRLSIGSASAAGSGHLSCPASLSIWHGAKSLCPEEVSGQRRYIW
jgi:hypothetical protein